MKFYTYWSKGVAKVERTKRPWTLCAYDGSNKSLEDAAQRADAKARRMADAIEREGQFGDYGYDDRPVREEIVQEIRNGESVAAVITRNSYGALVINTERVMFVDIDLPIESLPRPTLREFWNRLLRKPNLSPRLADEPIINRINLVGASLPNLGFRLYRTFGGFRLLVTSATYDPTSIEVRDLLVAFGSDPLYVRLCQSQECFRARLSAKFWRCRSRRPPSRYPWANAIDEAKYRKWEEYYHRRANLYATCEIVGDFGAARVDDEVQPILDIHDRLTLQAGTVLA